MKGHNDQRFKADGGKTRPLLVERGFARALRLVQATTDYGALKYAANSWRAVEDAVNRYEEAGARHRQQRVLDGGGIHSLDAESGLPHIAHELFCLMATIEKQLEEAHVDVEELCEFNPPPIDHKQ